MILKNPRSLVLALALSASLLSGLAQAAPLFDMSPMIEKFVTQSRDFDELARFLGMREGIRSPQDFQILCDKLGSRDLDPQFKSQIEDRFRFIESRYDRERAAVNPEGKDAARIDDEIIRALGQGDWFEFNVRPAAGETFDGPGSRISVSRHFDPTQPIDFHRDMKAFVKGYSKDGGLGYFTSDYDAIEVRQSAAERLIKPDVEAALDRLSTPGSGPVTVFVSLANNGRKYKSLTEFGLGKLGRMGAGIGTDDVDLFIPGKGHYRMWAVELATPEQREAFKQLLSTYGNERVPLILKVEL